MEAELLEAVVQGRNGVGVPQENVDTNTNETRNTMEITDQSVLQTENAQQQQDSASDLEDDAEDVVFICIHGQAFQCKPQVGIPIKEFKRKSMHTEGCCSCSKFPNITGEVQHGDDKNRKFACNECGKKFSPKPFADHPRPIQNDKDKSDTNGPNVDTKTTQQSTGRMNHDLDSSTTRQQNEARVRQDPRVSCQECGKVFTRQRALSMHMKQHNKERINRSEEKDDVKKTSQSDIVLPSTFQLPPHEDHSSYCQMQRYACEECPKVFNRLNKLRQHKKTHFNTKNQSDTEEPKELSCVKCSKVFSQPDILKKHELQHTKVAGKDIMCVLCLETFDDQIVYKAHEKGHLKKSKSNEMKCEVCQKVFKGLSTLQRHTEIHNTEDQFPCRLGCNLSFASSADRTKHEVRYCKMGEKFLCSFCGEVFCNKNQFQVHKAKFHWHSLDEHLKKPQKKEYQCSYCNQVFGFLTAFRRHERIHTNKKPFKCRFCPKAFLRISSLSCHERVHTKERPFQCEVCGRAFSQDAHRRTHMRLHTGEKPHQCQICKKSFSHSGTLKLHEKTHENPRRRGRKPGPFAQKRRSIQSSEKINKCQYCGKIFTHFQTLMNHELIHTNEKPFKCNVCGKTFRQHPHLTTHKLVHTGEKPHKCKICGRAFALKGNCRAHEKTHDKTTCSSRVRKTASRSASKTSDGTAAQRSNNQDISEDDTLTQEVQGEKVIVQGHEVEQRITVQHSEEDVQETAIILQLLESAW